MEALRLQRRMTKAEANAETVELVHQVYDPGWAHGGCDVGPRGQRGDSDMFYGAYFRDPEGNKFCAFRVGPAAT